MTLRQKSLAIQRGEKGKEDEEFSSPSVGGLQSTNRETDQNNRKTRQRKTRVKQKGRKTPDNKPTRGDPVTTDDRERRHGGTEKRTFLVWTSTIFGADVHDPIEKLCTIFSLLNFCPLKSGIY